MKLITGTEAKILADRMSDARWTHALTFTARHSESPGDIWCPCASAIEKLGKADPSAEYIITICRKSRYEHFHAHGVIRSTLPIKRIAGCFEKGWTDLKRIYSQKGWADYVVEQAIAGTQISSISFEMAN